jgi:hypothetical protein
MTRRLIGAAVASVALLAPAAANAADVHVAAVPDDSQRGEATAAAFYDAAPGEANRLMVTFPDTESGAPPDVTLQDSGAVIHAGAGCTSVGAHSARCSLANGGFSQEVRADLGDADDQLLGTNHLFATFDRVIADGGPGDDLLTGGYEEDVFRGGGGHDELHGGNNADRLIDGDHSGAAGAARPGPDLLDGGPGSDEVSYTSRKHRVTVNLAKTGATAGERGEGDTVRHVEDVSGGHASDRLTGSSARNRLAGRGGADLLTARSGAGENDSQAGDDLLGGSGRDRLKGSEGSDLLEPGSGLDSLSCGLGADTVVNPVAREVIGSCETLRYEHGVAGSGFALLELPPHPVIVLSRTVEFKIACTRYFTGGKTHRACPRRISIHQASGRKRLLGRAHITKRDRKEGTVTVQLTARGRRLANRSRGVLATMSLRGGSGFFPVDWTTRLLP